MPRASLSTEIPPEPARIVEVGHGFGGGVVTMRAPRTSARGPPPEHPRPARSLGDGSGGAGDDACSEERFTGHPHSLIMMKIRAGFSNGGKCRCFLAEVSLLCVQLSLELGRSPAAAVNLRSPTPPQLAVTANANHGYLRRRCRSGRICFHRLMPHPRVRRRRLDHRPGYRPARRSRMGSRDRCEARQPTASANNALPHAASSMCIQPGPPRAAALSPAGRGNRRWLCRCFRAPRTSSIYL